MANEFSFKVFNMETFRWSFGILFSRLVRLPSMDGKVALVPWADMLNHSCEVETFLDYDKSSQGVVFTTDRAYQPGEQVFISYGKKSNGELLLSYGFVPKEGTNPSDSVELPLSLKKSDKCYKEKLEALKKHGLSAKCCSARSKTAVRVGATAGLRALGGEAFDKILQSVRELLKSRSTLKSEANGVKILDGSQEGSYEWSCLRCFNGGAGANWRNPRGFSGVTINYLLGNLGMTYQDTVGIVDLGGGSVQMAYAISKNAASRAPSLPVGQDNYVNEMYLKGSKYYLYVHRYPPF
ncbi:hypothetical protein CXB51_001203 [Gossypium anomalum]|uniref:apyrase n=1 Tax=Gossypium anomalum TaxID=47600 RepID=A0A8J5ZKP8_9ROSI|nr:hypothetical protein CXB51_001203 [Gossypium anomalum]